VRTSNPTKKEDDKDLEDKKGNEEKKKQKVDEQVGKIKKERRRKRG
jgi:hypothetical protein